MIHGEWSLTQLDELCQQEKFGALAALRACFFFPF